MVELYIITPVVRKPDVVREPPDPRYHSPTKGLNVQYVMSFLLLKKDIWHYTHLLHIVQLSYFLIMMKVKWLFHKDFPAGIDIIYGTGITYLGKYA